MSRWWVVLFCASLSLLGAGNPQIRDAAKEARIEQQLAASDATQVQDFHAATIAMDKGNNAEAERLFAQVYQAVPTFDAAPRRLGNLLVQDGKREEGLALCRKAVALNRSMENLSTLAYCLAFTPKGKATPKEQEEALRLLLACRDVPPGHEPDVLMITAQISLQLDRMASFKEATRDLLRYHPDLMQTHYFVAIDAAIDEHWMKAEREIRIAQRMGLPDAEVQRFLDSGVGSRAMGWHVMIYTLVAVGVWAAGMLFLFATGFILSKGTMRQAGRIDSSSTVSASERLLRRIYRLVLNVAGIYYYLSLPIVLVLVIATTCAVFYGFLVIGWLPLKLLLVLGIGAVVTIWAMGKSLFLKVNREDPGRPLAREEAEGLWELTDEVAHTLGTRPIDEIRITPGTDLAVYEKGSWREKMGNNARRMLILGTANLHGFKQDDFRCVLAHEYGHFSHRDTAGGDIALRVQNDMVKFYLTMRDAGQATLMNVAFHFLRFYNFLFRRISHGATRLQEILADRVAAQSYGALALEGGLRHVIRRGIEFDASANHEIKDAIDSRRPLQNLYEVSPVEGHTVEEDFEKAMTRKTTEDDTHPSPQDRFRLVSRFSRPRCEPRTGNVWDLFRDPAGITREMMQGFEERVAPYRSAEDKTLKSPSPNGLIQSTIPSPDESSNTQQTRD